MSPRAPGGVCCQRGLSPWVAGGADGALRGFGVTVLLPEALWGHLEVSLSVPRAGWLWDVTQCHGQGWLWDVTQWHRQGWLWGPMWDVTQCLCEDVGG